MHPEPKFRGGDLDERGTLRRRRVHVWAVTSIGKEADSLEEREVLGEGEDDTIAWPMAGPDRRQLAAGIVDLLRERRVSERELTARAGVSHHTLAALRNGRSVTSLSLLKLARASEDLRQVIATLEAGNDRWRNAGLELAQRFGGVSALASLLRLSRQYVGRVLKAEKPMSPQMARRLSELVDATPPAEPSTCSP